MSKRITKKSIESAFRGGNLKTAKFAAFAPIAGIVDGEPTEDAVKLENPSNVPDITMSTVSFAGGKAVRPSFRTKGDQAFNLTTDGVRSLAVMLGCPTEDGVPKLPDNVEALLAVCDKVNESGGLPDGLNPFKG